MRLFTLLQTCFSLFESDAWLDLPSSTIDCALPWAAEREALASVSVTARQFSFAL